MTGSSYSELLRLTAPEIVVALTGILVLVLDLSFLRRASLALRFRSAAVAATSGCILALGCWRDSLRQAACRRGCW